MKSDPPAPTTPQTRPPRTARPGRRAATAVGPVVKPAAGTPAPRHAEPAAVVDETALVRGFVERFERLLAEQDELRRRAQVAEERVATVEKLLRTAERRAETAEARLEQAQDKLRNWADLTKRMQQLSRQADSVGRSKLPSQRSA